MRLNWGSAGIRAEEWLSSDLVDWTALVDDEVSSPDHVGDILDGLPWDDGHFDTILSNHSLQMIRYSDLPKALGELLRVLKPGGVLRILVPDPLAAIDAYERGDRAWFPIVNEAETSDGGKLCAYLTWYSEARTLFTPAWLSELCVRAGFAQTAVTIVGLSILSDDPEVVSLDSRPNESIVVEARKGAIVDG